MNRILLFIVTVLTIPVFILQAQGGTVIKINHVTADLSLETISIHGINFDAGPLDVRIGDTYLDECPTVTPTLIVCSIANTPVLSGGTWKVSISAGNAPAKNSEIDVFIPAGFASQCNSGDYVECYSGQPETQDVGECSPGIRTCLSDGTWGDCVGEVLPQDEICDDGLDNDCDGEIDNGCAPPPECTAGQSETCYSGQPGTQDVGECSPGIRTCLSDGTWSDCVGEVLPQDEICDGLDNNCDGQTDNVYNLGQSCTVGVGACMNTGQYVCTENGDEAECDASPLPPGIEGPHDSDTCSDFIDNDCDGLTDQMDSDCQ